MLGILLAGLQVSVLAGAAPDSLVHVGRDGDIRVPVPRIQDRVMVDGMLAEPAWSNAAILTGFSQYQPVDSRAAEDTTQVLVWHSATEIFFGVRAFAAAGAVNATLSDRDKVESDDYVQLFIDTFNDLRQALVFSVNPLGVQSDGIWSEGQETSSTRPAIVDLTRDFVFESKGHVTEYGYEVEIRIPFKSISYQASRTQDWGFNVVRKVQRSGYVDTWTPTRQANASFLAQGGTLVGLTDIRRGLVADFTPVATGTMAGQPAAAGGGWEYGDAKPEVGFDLRLGFSNNLTLDATANPDFSQVEADVGRIMSNQRFALYFPEKRPFFLEGIEKFETPNQLIYTRRIVNPVAGGKLTGKLTDWSVGFLSAVDGRNTSATADDYPVFNVLRLRRDLGSQSWGGFAYTDRIDGADYNRVAAADLRMVFAELYYLQLQGGGSVTRSDGRTAAAPIWEAILNRAGRRFSFAYRFTGIHPDFEAQSGFVPRTDVFETNIANSLSWYGERSAIIEKWTNSVRFAGWWDYDGIWHLAVPMETKLFLGNAFTLRGGWTGSVTLAWETTAWDQALYEGYAVERRSNGAVDTVAFLVPERVNDGLGVLSRFNTPEFKRLSASLAVNRFHDVGFVEATKVNLLRITADLNLRPTDRLRVSARYARLVLDRRRDDTNLSKSQIPRLKIEYQISRPIFVRFVGQYASEKTDALRDPRTEEPILLLAEDPGTYVRSTPHTVNDLRLDLLFSYRPNPGTVLYLGYGSSLTEPEAFAFSDLRRTDDGFFFKLSYLFRW